MSQPPQPPSPSDPSQPQDPQGAQPPFDGQGQPASQQPPQAPSYGSSAASAEQAGAAQYGQQEPQFGAAAPSYGAQQTVPQQSQQPQKSGIGKGAIFAILGCVLLVIVLVLGVGGFFAIRALTADGDDPQGTETSEETTEPGEESSEPTDEESTEPQESSPADEESTPADDESDGSAVGQENALPAGSTIDFVGSGGVAVSVTFGEVNWNAGDAVMEANSFNEAAPEGQKYVLVDMAIVNDGEQEFSNFAWSKVDYVDADGNVYGDARQVTPVTAAGEDGPAAPGDSTKDQALFLVPEDLPEGGYFAISDFMEPEDGIWVEAV